MKDSLLTLMLLDEKDGGKRTQSLRAEFIDCLSVGRRSTQLTPTQIGIPFE